MKALLVEQSLPICCSLAALGGILEVAATAVTAVPAVREKEGIPLNWWVQVMAIVGNVSLQAVGSLLSHLIATWFGPVSLVVPFFYSATLLSNMIIFGVLGEKFTKNMRVGTHVIVVAVILLPVVGPTIQDHQEIALLIQHWYALAWFGILVVACATTGFLVAVKDLTLYSMRTRMIILLVARATAISINLTVSRAFIMGPSQSIFISLVVLKLISGAIYTYAIIIQSYVVEQARFVPLNATTIIIINAITGIAIWEDWKVLSSWYGYVCIFVLLGLGCDLLLSVPLLNAENPEFGTQRASMLLKKTSSLRRFRHSDANNGTSTNTVWIGEFTDAASTTTPAKDTARNWYGSVVPEQETSSAVALESPSRLNRINAWKALVSPIHHVASLTPPRYMGSRLAAQTSEDTEETTASNGATIPLQQARHDTPPPSKEEVHREDDPSSSMDDPPSPPRRTAFWSPLSAAMPEALRTTMQQTTTGFFTASPRSESEATPLTTTTTTTPSAARQQQQHHHHQHEQRHLSRLAAWKETVSPTKTRSSLAAHQAFPTDVVDSDNDDEEEGSG